MGIGWGCSLKKLELAARYWTGEGEDTTAPSITIDTSLEKSLLFFGMSQADIDAQREKEKGSSNTAEKLDCEIHQDNWDSVMFFLKVQTQWVHASGGIGAVRVGLNHPAVESNMRMRGIKRSQQQALMDDLLVMELAVLDVDSERAKAEAEKEANR